MLLEEMYNKYNILNKLRYGLIEKGYSIQVISYLNGQIDLLNKLITKESFNVLNDLLKKTNYRLLKSIDKGNENLIDIINNPDQFKLGLLKDNTENFIDNDCLIFSTERYVLMFSKHINGQKYISNKWQ